MFVFLLLFPGPASGQCGDKCCPMKTVGGVSYTLSYENDLALKHGCLDSCVYTEDGGGGADICFQTGNLSTQCHQCRQLPGLPKKYCQPGEEWCWPTREQISNLSASINGTSESCLSLKKFVSIHDPSAHIQQCLKYTGLLTNISQADGPNGTVVGGDLRVCNSKPLNNRNFSGNYGKPDPNCNTNPFITNAYYLKGSNDKMSCMTPYQFLNNRNYKLEWMAAFIVTAETSDDVSKAIIFAKRHNLGIAIMGTGGDLQDRNAGPGPNSLLIRTTCFRKFTPILNASIKGYEDQEWNEGYAIVGAGLTFGQNLWWDIENAEGLYPLAAAVNREIVGGSCHIVGIVGWTIAGGKGWTAPMYGLGVDQLLHVDLVSSNGTQMSANFSHNEDLFYALRGGGGGFGIITSLKLKLHKPICGSMENCYSLWNTSWTGTWNQSKLSDIKDGLANYFDWQSKNSRYWNSFNHIKYDNDSGNYSLSISAWHFGGEENNVTQFNSFLHAFQNFSIDGSYHEMNNKNAEENAPPIVTNKYFCEIFPDPSNSSNCTFYPWNLQRWSQAIRYLVNSTTTTKKKADGSNSWIDTLLKYWQPMCDEYPNLPCVTGYQIAAFYPAINETSGQGVYSTGGAISDGFREASIEVFEMDVQSKNKKFTFEEKENWLHFSLAPAMYKFSNASYFNEAQYTLGPGHWEERFWGKEKHCKLSQIKKKYDPDFTFACRHCIGSEVANEPAM